MQTTNLTNISDRDVEILKARLVINRTDKDTSMKSDQYLHNIINTIKTDMQYTTLIRDSLFSVANGGFLRGARYELQNMLNKDKVSNRELDIKIFRFAVKVWLAVDYEANFAIADFFATWLYRNLPKEELRRTIDNMYSVL